MAHWTTCWYSRGRNGTKKSTRFLSIRLVCQNPPTGRNQQILAVVPKVFIKADFRMITIPMSSIYIYSLFLLLNTDRESTVSRSLSSISSRFRPALQKSKAVSMMLSPPALLGGTEEMGNRPESVVTTKIIQHIQIHCTISHYCWTNWWVKQNNLFLYDQCCY